MQEIDLFRLFLTRFDQLSLDYFITGSVASLVYGEPRLTNDIDLIVNLHERDIEKFCKIFPLDIFYCPPKEVIFVELFRKSRGHFNLIHHESGFKADVYLLGTDPFQKRALQNRKTIEYMGDNIYLAPPEYVIIKKLEFYKEGGAQKHLDDIASILKNSSDEINFNFLQNKINDFGLSELFNKVQDSQN